METDNKSYQNYIKSEFPRYNYNFVGNHQFMGQEEGREEERRKGNNGLIKQINHIMLINNRHIRSTMIYKFLTYNKVTYILKNIDTGETKKFRWLSQLESIFLYIHDGYQWK